MAEALSAVATKASPRAVANASWSGRRNPVASSVEVEDPRTIARKNFRALQAFVFMNDAPCIEIRNHRQHHYDSNRQNDGGLKTKRTLKTLRCLDHPPEKLVGADFLNNPFAKRREQRGQN